MTLNLLREHNPPTEGEGVSQLKEEHDDRDGIGSTGGSDAVDVADDEASDETDSIAPAPSTSRAASVYPDMSVPSLIFDNGANDQKGDRRDSHDTATRSLDDAPSVTVALGSPQSIVRPALNTETEIETEEGIDTPQQGTETRCPEADACDKPAKRLSGVSFMTVTFGEL